MFVCLCICSILWVWDIGVFVCVHSRGSIVTKKHFCYSSPLQVGGIHVSYRSLSLSSSISLVLFCYDHHYEQFIM